MYYSSKRQQFLIDQGYAFKVITGLPPESAEGLVYSTKMEQLRLLNSVLMVVEEDIEDEDVRVKDDVDTLEKRDTSNFKLNITKTGGNMRSLSGGDDMAYMEINRSKGSKRQSSTTHRHHLFKKYLPKK